MLRVVVSQLKLWKGTGMNKLAIAALVAALSVTARSTEASANNTVSSAVDTTCAIRSGKLYCWGQNADGQIGNGAEGSTPVNVATIPTGMGATGAAIQSVGVGEDFVCAIQATTSGSNLYCWGHTEQILGTASDTLTPTLVAGLPSTVYALAVGEQHVCVLADQKSTGGLLYCFGQNSAGQLGIDSTAASFVPVLTHLGGLTTGDGHIWSTITAGALHTCGLYGSTTAPACWGYNGDGELGTGTTTNGLRPEGVPAPSGVSFNGSKDISGTLEDTCLIASTGVIYCWGGGTLRAISLETGAAPPLGTGWSGLDMCFYQPAGVGLYCWGDDGYGELGSTAAPGTTNYAILGAGFAGTVALGEDATFALGFNQSHGRGSGLYGWGTGIGFDGAQNFLLDPSNCYMNESPPSWQPGATVCRTPSGPLPGLP